MDSPHALASARLGETAGEIPLEGREQVRAAVLALCTQARDTLRIVSPALDSRLFGQADLEAALSRFLRAHRRAQARILVQNARALAQEDHRLLELSRRLSSHLEIRLQHEDFAEFRETWVLADTAGLLRLPLSDRYIGTVVFHGPQAVRDRGRTFDAMWDNGRPDPELRRLHL